MIYRVKNISSKKVYIADIPGFQTVTIDPGKTVDFESFATRNQILESSHIKVKEKQGSIIIDTAGTLYTPDERFYVDAYISSGTTKIISSDQNPIVVSTNFSGLDRFSRQRVANPELVFESHFTFSDLPEIWGNKIAGTASATYLQNQASVSLTVGTSAGDSILRRTHRHFNYHPGLSYMILMTGVLGEPKIGLTQKIGYFSDSDGLFFQQKDGELSVAIRSSTSGSPLEEIIAQSSWNLDKLDGTGPSKIVLDPSKTQIFLIDLSWLGVGGVRFGIVVGQQVVYVHEFVKGNQIDFPYMRTAVLPLSYQIENTASTDSPTTMKAICSSIIKEGTGGLAQTNRSVNTGTVTKTINSSNFTSILAIRLQANYKHATLHPESYSLSFSSTADALVEIVKNPILVGASFNPISGSIIEADTSSTTISGGQVIYSEYVRGPQIRSPLGQIGSVKEVLGTSVDGNIDVVAIRIITLSGTSSVAASINFSETY